MIAGEIILFTIEQVLDSSLNHLDALIFTFDHTLNLRQIEPAFSVKAIDSFYSTYGLPTAAFLEPASKRWNIENSVRLPSSSYTMRLNTTRDLLYLSTYICNCAPSLFTPLVSIDTGLVMN